MMLIGPGDIATWVGASVAIFAAIFTSQQVTVAKQQLADSRMSAAADDERRRKQAAVDFAQEWCRTEAPSPIAILRECLIACDRDTITALLNGKSVGLPKAFDGELRTFFDEVLRGHAALSQIQSLDNGTILVSENYAHLVRNFFARRLNYFEVVAGAFNSGLVDHTLFTQFFGRILDTNSSYKLAIRINPAAWPELAKYYGSSIRS